MNHLPDRSCCAPTKVRLQRDLFNRLRARFYTDAYARALAAWEGRVVLAVHTFPSSYTIETPDGKSYHCDKLYADPV